MEYSLNIIGMYPDLGMEDTIKAAVAKGYRTFENWAADKNGMKEMGRLEKEYGVRFSATCAREFSLNDPANREKYLTQLEGLLQDMQYCSTRSIITQVGMDTGAPRAEQHASIVEGLKAAAPLLEKYGAVLLVEPLNTKKDHIGYYLHSSQEGFDIIREVNSPNVRLLFDIYHQMQMEEDVVSAIRENLEHIAHFHVAGWPDRNEKLWEGKDYTEVLTLIRDSGTKAPVGIELFPTAPDGSDKVLEELKRFL